ncbi:immunoglobulin superfamily containing leucine-rich repeat protein [Plakobranchus ocellatus]|uniref:Immunoglobulin superfamily containing leucine-rich repeat protein n=1 Tax=Plakobranchus ocellatus TaxID=259542 RepID=A0AAV3XX01_9GAST|nr:immunoglobulin superfamily containing leucine-rich repeat protein [Plakobranchus ocellatus]
MGRSFDEYSWKWPYRKFLLTDFYGSSGGEIQGVKLLSTSSSRPRKMSPCWSRRGREILAFPLLLKILLVCLCLLPAPSIGQPAAQKCTYNTAHTEANCSGLELRHVPWGLHKNIMTLDLSGNIFPKMEGNRFLSYRYLKTLYLRNNSMKEMESASLKGPSYLKILDLTNNRLQEVPVTALSQVANTLERLVLAGNKIYQIPARAFSGMSKLQYLDLSGNSINKVNYGAFRGLESLQVLKLRHNALKTLPADAFDDFPANMVQVQLYENRWVCDCNLRWLRRWMNATDAAVWNSTGYHVRCDGPSIVRDASLDSRSLDELACKIEMKTSGATRELVEGADTSLLCKYSSVPQVDATWLRNSEIINAPVVQTSDTGSDSGPGPAAIAAVPTPASTRKRKKDKFRIRTWAKNGYHGELIQVSELLIHDFRYEDIAAYQCFVQNIRGDATTEYRLTLEGVAFDSVTMVQPSKQKEEPDSSVDIRKIVIAVAVVCGIVLIVAIGVLIFCSVNRIQRRKKEKREAIEETVKQHFIENSEIMTNGDASGVHDMSKSIEDGLDGKHPGANHDHRSFSNDSSATVVKRPFDLSGDKEEAEPAYIFQQPGSPFNNGNTYVSFGSELTDPGEFSMVPMGTLGRGGQQPNPGQNQRHLSSSRGYESSHAGSGTPLLDRGTPSVLDSDEPIEDYAQYPVYDSLTNTLQRPNGETSSVYGGSLHHPMHRHEGIYGGSLRQGEGIYGGSLHQYPLRPTNGEGIYGGSMRNGVSGSPATLGRAYAPHRTDPAKRMSSFHYPPATNSPMPRTPTNARPSSTLPAPVPRYPDYRNGYSSAGSHSPRLDHKPAHHHHYHHGVPESPNPHNRTMPNHPDYRDYREMRYPTTTPPPQRMNAGQKSMSVGNLGYYQPLPVAGAPRKPPRLFQSREYMELSPAERETQIITPTSPANGVGADYITSPEAQQYGQSYGITPGTPV